MQFSPVFKLHEHAILDQFSCNYYPILMQLSPNSHLILMQLSPNSHTIITQFSPNVHAIITHLSPNSHAILTQCSVNSHLMLSQFSTNAHSILNLCSCKYHPIFTYNAQWNVNIVDWYVDWIRNCIKLIVYYHNHENTSYFDCLSTHLYIQDWNPCARSSAKPTNSLAGPSDSIQWHGSGSTLALLMAWCLMASSHHLYQYWFLITTVQWDSSEGSFTRDAPAINHWN